MRQVLQPRGEPLEEVVFPLLGVASMISMGDSGESVEVATIGCEGIVGLPLFLGGEKAAVEIFVQVPGEALFLAADEFHDHLARETSLTQTLLLYTQALLTQIAQCSACNCHHPIEARCARWLLQTHDRVKGDGFPLTTISRPDAGSQARQCHLEPRGRCRVAELIIYHRGVVTVLNRKGLEAAACECYQLISDEFDRLLNCARRSGAAS